MMDLFEGWDTDLYDEYQANPSQELYEELFMTNLLRHSAIDISEDEIEHPNETFEDTESEDLAHYGTPRHSGRYPWGSGKNPQRNRNFIQRADELLGQGLSEKEVAAAFKMSTTDYRAMRRIYRDEIDAENQQKAIKLHDKGRSNVAIAEELGVSEGTVRNYLNPNKKLRENKTAIIADNLKEVLKDKPYLDVGEGVHRQLNISEEALNTALLSLKDQGYNVYNYDLPQVSNPKQKTKLKVLTDGDVTKKDFVEHLGEVTSPDGIYFEDYGETVHKREPIPSIDSKRVAINYNTGEPGGGQEKDGVIEIRPGVEDLSLGGRSYAQVRIGVDGTHYLKGMAIYGDPKKMPDGVDIVFNTNKHEGTPMTGHGDNTVLKEMKKNDKGEIDLQNPFGAAFRQWDYQNKKGESVVSPINIVNDDEDWEGWKKNLSSQFLSKQMPALAKRQLDIRYGEMLGEFEELKSINNPTLRREFLDEFADSCDSAAVHLKAAALPRQGAFAILPVPSLKDNEIYAPAYENGEEVILVRHPHAGVFEIPRLTVNNDNPEGKKALGTTASHAVGINSHVANQLSGADYDGDTVLVIPTKNQKIKTAQPLEGLKDFSPTEAYARDPNDPKRTGKSDGEKIGDKFNKGLQMGMASNLITDMTIKNATIDEIERAVKHSMVIIDAEKHNLNWQQSEIDNGIAELRQKYQDGGGASTLISKARGDARIPEAKQAYGTQPMTKEEYKEYQSSGGQKYKYKLTPDEYERFKKGEVIYRKTDRKYAEDQKITDPKKMTAEELERYNSGKSVYRSTGKVKDATMKVSNMEAAFLNSGDAHELSSGYYIEDVYANHANRLYALGNEARKEARSTGLLKTNKSAEEAYKDVVGKEGSLAKKLALAELEAPKERQAQLIATNVMKAKVQADPSLNEKDKADKKRKLAAKALENARDAVNGGVHTKRYRIELSDREWEAIQAGALSDNKFKTIIRFSDKEELKKRATPRKSVGMSSSAKSRARILLKAGYPQSYVAQELGISVTTLRKEFNNFNGMSVGDD